MNIKKGGQTMNNIINNITETLTACGCKPAATINKDGETIIKVNAPTVDSFTFDDLTGDAREKARREYVDYIGLDFFQEDVENDLREKFPDSNLKIALSWLCCQGDGANIHGRICLDDFLPHWNATEKEKRTMRFYLSKGLCYYDFTGHNRYSYSCKFMDIDGLDGTVDDFVYYLPDLRDINTELIKRFFSDMFDFFRELDNAIYDDLYDYIYNPSDDDISDFFGANEIYFTAGGDII
jgi:hypothetical protein